MSILPRKRKQDSNISSNIVGATILKNGYNIAIDDCQAALDKAVEKAADEEKIKSFVFHLTDREINPKAIYDITDDYGEAREGLADDLAKALSSHIREVFDKG